MARAGSGKTIVMLMGPTAAGKTELALSLADHFPFELISVDSAMVYRGLDIGTAKPPPHLLTRYPHALIDIRDPLGSYSAADFRDDALEAIANIHSRGKTPLLVGGTGLYFRTLERGIAKLPRADAAIRARLEAEQRATDSAAMHERLRAVDPERARRIHPNDPQRILRALEVYEVSGQSMSQWLDEQQLEPLPYPVVKWVVAPRDRNSLHERIERRFRRMLGEGFVNEVRRLRTIPELNIARPAMRAVGYRAVWHYLDGAYAFDEMRRKGIVATRQLAKRQYTWFRAETGAAWFDSSEPDVMDRLVDSLKRHHLFQ